MHIIGRKTIILYTALFLSWCTAKLCHELIYAAQTSKDCIINNTNGYIPSERFKNNKSFLDWKKSEFPSQYSYLQGKTVDDITKIRTQEKDTVRDVMFAKNISALASSIVAIFIFALFAGSAHLLIKKYKVRVPSKSIHHIVCSVMLVCMIVVCNASIMLIKSHMCRNSDFYAMCKKHVEKYGNSEDLACPITSCQSGPMQEPDILYITDYNYMDSIQNMTAFYIDKKYSSCFVTPEMCVYYIIFASILIIAAIIALSFKALRKSDKSVSAPGFSSRYFNLTDSPSAR